jgi:hypothetical protein
MVGGIKGVSVQFDLGSEVRKVSRLVFERGAPQPSTWLHGKLD